MKIKLLFLISIIKFYSLAQQSPTNTSPGGIGPSGQNNVQFWSRAGNNGQGTNVNNIFGTLWNSGIYTKTNDQFRMKLNGTVNYTVNGYAGDRSGYLLLGATSADNYSNPNKGAASLLHLNGRYNTGVQPVIGYRPWMQTGITMTDNDDLSYFGLRRVGYLNDLTKSITETTICWSNDPTSQYGPDEMAFRFMGESGIPSTVISNNLLDNNDLDGRHVARFTNLGLFGLGNTFGVNGINDSTGIYIRPKSLLHMSYSNSSNIWSQFTNRDLSSTGIGTGGTGETDSDGLRMGIIGSTNNLINGTAAIYNQEDRHILFSTNATTASINQTNGQTNERVRITSVGTPTNLPISGYAVYNPAVIPANLTRVSISHDPSKPVTRPLSLLHLGYNTGTAILPFSTDGWRSWMDIGTFTSAGSDNIYIGFKNEGVDRNDAVINWGDNQGDTITSNGPDNLRFIFTANQIGLPSGDSISSSFNGLEIARMVPAKASTLTESNFGMMGIGDFSPSSPNNGINPITNVNDHIDAKLDIDGDLRIRTVTKRDTLIRVLVIDTIDHNRVHYRDIPLTNGTGQGFFDCSDTTSAPNLLSNKKINLNNNNLYFENNDSLGVNHVGIGYDCSNTLPAKISVLQTHPTTVNAGTTGTSSINKDVANSPALIFKGVYGESSGPNSSENLVTKSSQIGGDFYARNGFINIATKGIAGNIPNNYINTACIGGYFHSNTNLTNTSIGVGVAGISKNSTTNYGVYGSAPAGTTNRAGYFNGVVEVNGQFLGSDKKFKINQSKIGSALDIVKSMNALTYYFDTLNYSQFNFDSNKQYGFIAQELESILPEIVHESISPAIKDSLGDEISPAVNYKSVNYNAIIPINTQAIKELNYKVEKATLSDASIKTNVQDLSGSLQTILALRGVSFDWNQAVNEEYQLDSSNHIGFIAQEVESIEPRLTFTGDNNLLHVDYNKVVPVLVEAIQEQNAIISHQDSLLSDLTNRLNSLENCINALNLCNQNQPIQMAQPSIGQTVSLNTVQSIVLNQNVPNPFAEQTVITYSIPESVNKADLLFYDSNGKLINTVSIKERGNSQLNVFANDLSTGIYTYTLVADGQIVATKKMVKQ